MIVVRVELTSGLSRSRDRDLGTLILDNIACSKDGQVGSYRCRMYRKGAIERHDGDARKLVLAGTKPFREGVVHAHARLAEPIHNLVLKALMALGYAA